MNEPIGIRPVSLKNFGICPRCKKPLCEWYALGGKKYIGCSDITCEYKKESK